MSTEKPRPPKLLRRLAWLLIRGPDAVHILADLEHLALREVEHGGRRWRASLRYLRNTLASAFSVWMGQRGRRGWWPGTLTPDVKLAARMLVKNPLLSVVGGLGMAVAIAIGTGFFTFMAFYYSDAPVEDGDRVVSVGYIDGDDDRSTLFDYQLWEAELESVVDLAAYRADRRTLESPTTGPVPSNGVAMTASGFRAWRVAPLRGRAILESDEIGGAPRVVVIGHREWVEGFDGADDVIGREVKLNGAPHTIVGVMPESFRLPINHGFWTALATGAASGPDDDGASVRVFGRLAPGIDRSAAEDEVAALGHALAAVYPDLYARYRAAVRPYIRHVLDVQQYPAWVVWLMQVFAALVVTVVAVNVAVLVYARVATRRAEITVRTALGASRSRIVTQLFLEALALSIVAAGLGLLIAEVGFRQLAAAFHPQAIVPYWLFDGLPASTIPNAVGLAVFAALLVGVLPALQATGRRREGTLRELGGGTGLRLGRTWTVLICVQVAVTVGTLPAVVGLVWNYTPPPIPTFASSEVLTFRVQRASDLDGGTVTDGTDERLQEELLSRVSTIPGVASVGFAAHLPLRGRARIIEVENAAPTTEATPSPALAHEVGPGYFDVLGVSVLAGHTFDRGDLEPGTAPAVVSRAFVDTYFAGGSALGRRFRELPLGAVGDGTETWYEIVGVVEDLLKPARGGQPTPATYHAIPLGAESLTLLARARGVDAAIVAPRIREIALARAPDHEISLSVMDSLYRADRNELRFLLLVVGLITTSVLLLSAAGISAMMSFAVTRRRREIGIRTALGASRGQLFGSIFSRSGRQLGVGILVGSAVAFLLDRVAGGAMLGDEAAVLLALVAAIVLLSGLLATLGPARRAWRTHPMDALREE